MYFIFFNRRTFNEFYLFVSVIVLWGRCVSQRIMPKFFNTGKHSGERYLLKWYIYVWPEVQQSLLLTGHSFGHFQAFLIILKFSRLRLIHNGLCCGNPDATSTDTFWIQPANDATLIVNRGTKFSACGRLKDECWWQWVTSVQLVYVFHASETSAFKLVHTLKRGQGWLKSPLTSIGPLQ